MPRLRSRPRPRCSRRRRRRPSQRRANDGCGPAAEDPRPRWSRLQAEGRGVDREWPRDRQRQGGSGAGEQGEHRRGPDPGGRSHHPRDPGQGLLRALQAGRLRHHPERSRGPADDQEVPRARSRARLPGRAAGLRRRGGLDRHQRRRSRVLDDASEVRRPPHLPGQGARRPLPGADRAAAQGRPAGGRARPRAGGGPPLAHAEEHLGPGGGRGRAPASGQASDGSCRRAGAEAASGRLRRHRRRRDAPRGIARAHPGRSATAALAGGEEGRGVRASAAGRASSAAARARSARLGRPDAAGPSAPLTVRCAGAPARQRPATKVTKDRMAKSSQVDVRKLKDEVAEHLKRSRWEKAAEVLEQLVAAEPKDMAQQLRLGDTYRRMEHPQKAIESYQRAAKFFSDEGQLIKAIGAVKLILECDPRNAQAQKQLADMNARRMGKMPLAKVGIKSVPAQAAAPARAAKASVMEAASGAIAVDDPSQIELPPADEDEPLELDDGRAPSQAAARPRTTKLPPRKTKSFDLSGGDELELDPPVRAPAARSTAVVPASPGREIDLELDPDVPPPDAELLPDDAILTPEPEDLVAPEHEDEVISREEFGRQGGPIVDLLSSGAEEEIELLSISADEEVSSSRPTGPPTVSADDADLDRAFGNIAPEGAGVPTKVVTKKVPLFDDLPEDAFVALVNRLRYHRHGAGHLIIREGEPGRSFFIIVEGKVRVYKAGADGKEITLAHLGEGAFFGEMAMLSGAPRTANVVSEEETEILEVTDTVLR